MKIFHKENGKELVYVQMQDLGFLFSQMEISIPVSILKNIFDSMVVIDDKNRFDFVKFSEKEEIDFFKKIEYIVDFDETIRLSDEEFDKKIQILVNEMNSIVEKWNSMNKIEKIKDSNIFQRYENIEYILVFMSEIADIKTGKSKMKLPGFVKLPERKKRFFFWK